MHRGIVAALAACLLSVVAACGDGAEQAQQVEVVAGGGEQDGGSAADAFLDGTLIDMTVDQAGVLRLLTAHEGLTLWTVRAGELTRTSVRDLDATQVGHLATGPDGAVYLAMDSSSHRGVWKLADDGTPTRVVGVDRDGRGPAADGTPVTEAYVETSGGIAVASTGRMFLSETRYDPDVHELVRAVDDGRLRTVFGRDLTGLSRRDWADARTSATFAAGARATDVAIDRGGDTRLAAGPDGTLYAAPDAERVIVVRPDGTVAPVAGSRGGEDAAAEPEKPFAARGKAATTTLSMRSTNSGKGTFGSTRPSLSVDTRGDVYLTSVPASGDVPGSFGWTGTFTPEQKALLAASRAANRPRAHVLRVTPAGDLATAAANVDAAAVHGDWLYLARSFTSEDGQRRTIVVRTAIPR